MRAWGLRGATAGQTRRGEPFLLLTVLTESFDVQSGDGDNSPNMFHRTAREQVVQEHCEVIVIAVIAVDYLPQ